MNNFADFNESAAVYQSKGLSTNIIISYVHSETPIGCGIVELWMMWIDCCLFIYSIKEAWDADGNYD